MVKSQSSTTSTSRILAMLQDDCRVALAKHRRAGRSGAAVGDRAHQEARGRRRDRGYHAALDARRLGHGHHRLHRRVTTSARPDRRVSSSRSWRLDDVLECHHVTGEYTLLLKVKTANTSSLEQLISADPLPRRRGAHRDHRGAVDARRGQPACTLHAERAAASGAGPARAAKRPSATPQLRARVRRETP